MKFWIWKHRPPTYPYMQEAVVRMSVVLMIAPLQNHLTSPAGP
jgi:hypothetical protein